MNKRRGRKKLNTKDLKISKSTSKQQMGVVISDNMINTRVVYVKRRILQKKYKKVVTKTKRYLVHDENSISSKGDLVKFSSTRPISKRKRWIITDIL
jgi:small subunit ribosomal protein S17